LETYPTINTIISDSPIIAFDKIDGSNIRAEWSRKSGFTKFGTRRRLLEEIEKPLGEAISLIEENFADELDAIFRKQRFERMTAFFEFAGENSFAGFHEIEPHKVVLFDLHQYKKGILPAREFLKLVEGKVPTPAVIYEGKANRDFVHSVKNSTVEGMTFEGVVCKGGYDSRNRLISFKVKSQAWLDKLKTKYVNAPEMYEKLK